MTVKLRIIDMLDKYAQVYKHENMGKYFGYSRAKAMIQENIPEDALIPEIKTLLDAGIYGIGPSIGSKIEALIDGKTPEHYDEIVKKYVEYHLDKKVVNPHKHYMSRTTAESIVSLLNQKLNECGVKYTICGSYRRQSEIVGDLDYLIVAPNLDMVSTILRNIDADESWCTKVEFLAEGEQKIKVEYTSIGQVIEIDFRAIMPGQLGSMLLHFTGPREFNIKLRNKALSMGYSLNEYGLHKLDGTETFTSDKESDFFNKLGMDYVAPENRR